MPREREHIPVNRIIPFEDMKLIMMGFRPAGMEDKWFMYCDEDTIRIYRSWTGICIYAAHFEPFKTDYLITTLAVNRDSFQYIGMAADKEVALFFRLLDFFRMRRSDSYTEPSECRRFIRLPEKLIQRFRSGEIDVDEYTRLAAIYLAELDEKESRGHV